MKITFKVMEFILLIIQLMREIGLIMREMERGLKLIVVVQNMKEIL